MAKQTPAKKPENTGRGKGKVTPVQISLIVDRYLAENNFTNTLATFRSEAAALFSKTRGKEVPKGLLSLSDILDDYILLKEQKMMVDREKRRVEMFSQSIQDVMRVYHCADVTSLPSPPSLVGATSVAPMLTSNPSNGSLPAQLMHSMPIVTSVPAMIPTKYPDPKRFPTPITNPSSKMKRKTSKLVTKEPPAPKRSRVQLPTDASMDGAVKQTFQVSTNNTGTEVMVGKFSSYQTMVSSQSKNGPSPRQGSSVAKCLFKQLPESQVNTTSPKTPPLAFPSPADKFGSPTETSTLFQTNGAYNSLENTSPNCSVISSKTIVVSPFKQIGYYSKTIVSSSPLKSHPKKLIKRDHVKGRLDFDSDVPSISEQPATVEPLSDEKMQNILDFDLPDLDIDFSVAELLDDFDLDCDGIAFPDLMPPYPSADFVPGSQNETEGRNSVTDQPLSDPSLTSVTGVLYEKDMNIQGPDSLKSVKTVTTRVKIVSPVKS